MSHGPPPVRVVIAHRSRTYGLALGSRLGDFGDLVVEAVVERASDAVAAAVLHDVDVVVADDRLPDGGAQGLAATLVEREVRARVVEITSSPAPGSRMGNGWRAGMTALPPDATGVEWHAVITDRRRTR